MYHALKHSLFDYLLKGHGAVCAREVQDKFNDMGLPMPEALEYRDTTDGGALVFLNTYGTTLRVTARNKLLDETALRHPHILQPLGTFTNTALKIDIYPGIPPLRDISRLSECDMSLAEHDLQFSDRKIENTGCIAGHAVIIDIPAVVTVNNSPKLLSSQKDDFQAPLYGDLRHAFTAAVQNENFHDFWTLCADKHQTGFLQSSWMHSGHQDVITAASQYESRLIQSGKNAQPAYPTHYQGYNLGALL